MTEHVSERAQHLLKVLIEQYVREGQPVGSRSLARESGLNLSPATVRNVMSDLEDMDLVSSPHTSAGRIPTTKGYRLFVDSLLTIQPLEQQEIDEIRGRIDSSTPKDELIESTADMLSSITSMAGVVMVPRQEHRRLRHIEFLPLSNQRVLAILVVDETDVLNKIIHTSTNYTHDELKNIENYLNQAFLGKDIFDVRENLIREMKDARDHANQVMNTTIEVVDQAFSMDQETGEFLLSGQNNLMGFTDLGDLARLRDIFDIFHQKRTFLQLLDQCLIADGINIFIGNESGYHAFDDCSVVTSTYGTEGEALGVLGVVGPARMNYERVISIVDVTAKLLSAALTRNQ